MILQVRDSLNPERVLDVAWEKKEDDVCRGLVVSVARVVIRGIAGVGPMHEHGRQNCVDRRREATGRGGSRADLFELP